MFDGIYVNWTQKKIKTILDYYGHKFFFNKSIVDLGCGYANVSAPFYRLGSKITAVDARKEHISIINKKYNDINGLCVDLNSEWPFKDQKHDIFFHFGLLNLLSEYENHLKAVCESASYLILECAVADSDDPNFCKIQNESKKSYDGSITGTNLQVSAAAIERVLKDCKMIFKRIDSIKLNCGPYQYGWASHNDGSFDLNKRRMWFCEKQQDKKEIFYEKPAVIDLQKVQPKPTALPIDAPIIVPSKVILHEPIKIEEKKKRIAILITGHMRVFEKTSKSFIKNLLGDDKNSADVFIHTWDTLGANESKEGSDGSIQNVKTQTKINEINNIYNVKNIVIENDSVNDLIKAHIAPANLTKEEKKGFHGNEIFHYSSMLYGWKKALDILEEYEKNNNIKYDIVVKYRPDIIFRDPLILSKKDVAPKTVYSPNIAYYYNNGINDQFAYGDHDAMKVYFSLYDKLIEYLNKKVTNPLRPETLLKFHLKNSGINISIFSTYYFLLRNNGKILFPLGPNMDTTTNQNLIINLI